MNILVVTPDFPPNGGGIGNLAYNFSKWTDFDVDILTEDCPNQFPCIDNIEIFTADSLSGLLGIYRCVAFIRSRTAYDAIYFLHPFLSAAGVFVDKKCITHAHGNELIGNSMRSMVMKYIVRVGLNNSDGIIANSNWTMDKITSMGISENSVVQISPGIPPDLKKDSNGSDLREEFEINKDTPIILTVGRLVERKGHDLVIKAIKDLDIEYFICGSGETRAELEELVFSLDVGNKVHFQGYVPDSELHKYYTGADIFVMPSRRISHSGAIEGFGIVYLEANAFGLPVIGGATGGVPSAVNDYETGLLTPPEPKSIRDCLLELINTPELYRRLSENGREWAARHEWGKISSEMDEYMSQFI